MSSTDKKDEYNLGYWDAVRDIWILLMEIAETNSSDIEKRINNLAAMLRTANENTVADKK